jgi:hypothetical protein
VYLISLLWHLVTSVALYAGLVGSHGTNNGVGSNARFERPYGICATHAHKIIVVDNGAHQVRWISSSGGKYFCWVPAFDDVFTGSLLGAVSAFAGHSTSGFIDGVGTAAYFSSPRGVDSDTSYVYVADTGNNAIRSLSAAAVVHTLAGGGGGGFSGSVDGLGTNARFTDPYDVVVYGNYLLVTDSGNHVIRSVSLGAALFFIVVLYGEQYLL